MAGISEEIHLDDFSRPDDYNQSDDADYYYYHQPDDADYQPAEQETPFDGTDQPNEETPLDSTDYTPAWAASSVPPGDLADAQHTKALVDRWQIERGKVQQKLLFASSKKGDLWLRWGKDWLLLTNKNTPGKFLAHSTILSRFGVNVAKALGVYNSTGLSPQDSAVLNETDQQVDEAASDIETVPLEDLGQTIIKADIRAQVLFTGRDNEQVIVAHYLTHAE
ncbi:hypothetical protein RRG08_067173 [Elysia crispata]|uniref:Uncharacterized protein n=1 Tax=Elysia crispata TaxID=231223 RepID=A0AAE1E9W7_9GAST|nr:hypothetical protein RRG08_067173 [Elysia crispata]